MVKLPTSISMVTESTLAVILKNRTPGRFLCLEKDRDRNIKICAVDNSTGDAWTESFDSLVAAVYWLENRTATVEDAVYAVM